MSKIKVIHFIDRISRGGTQAVLYDWLKNIDREKIQFDFLVFMNGQEEYITKFRDLGCNIYQISPLSIKKLPQFWSDLNSFFKEHKYDIAHGHSKSKNVLFLLAALIHGIPVRIAHSHNTKFQKMAFVGELLKPLLKVVATDFFACSDIAGKWLFGRNAYEQGKITIIKNGVDTQLFQYNEQIRHQYRTNLNLEDAAVYGHVGKYMEQKNHTFLLDIFAEIHRMQPSAKLLLIGGGYDTYIGLVNKKIVQLGLQDSVIQLGVRSDVPKLMQAMDVFLLPSLYEGLPVVGVEAQVAGLPLLLSDTITKEVGLLKSTRYMSLQRTAHEWADAAIKAYEENTRSRILAAADIYNQGYDSKQVAEQLMQVYIERINNGI